MREFRVRESVPSSEVATASDVEQSALIPEQLDQIGLSPLNSSTGVWHSPAVRMRGANQLHDALAFLSCDADLGNHTVRSICLGSDENYNQIAPTNFRPGGQFPMALRCRLFQRAVDDRERQIAAHRLADEQVLQLLIVVEIKTDEDSWPISTF